MGQVYATLAIQPVQAFDHVIRLTGALCKAAPGGNAGTVTPRGQSRHGPEPGLLGGTERLGPGEG